jgi:S-adenosylmethionine synthetase
MPAPITYAHALAKKLTDVRKSGQIGYLRPDGKSQVSIRYINDKPVHIDTVVMSTQHAEAATHAQITKDLIEQVIRPTLPGNLISAKTRFLINPTGRFVVGGPQGDCGLTGRKIIVDTYGGMGRHGGGAFSGKDPSKVDRSATYMARYVAKNIVAAGLAARVELQIAYAIGYPEPVSLHINAFGTAKVDEVQIEDAVREVFSFKPANIIQHLDLLRPVYKQTAAYGHFGRDIFTWEKTDKADALREACLSTSAKKKVAAVS